MMEDTPSNYNIPNGRLDGQSIGLKALILHAKKQGIKVPPTGQSIMTTPNKNGLEMIEEIRKMHETP